jgi:hypothetical protein
VNKIFVVVKPLADGFAVEVGRGERPATLRFSTATLRPFTEAAAEAPHLTELLEFFLAYYSADRLALRSHQIWSRNFVIRFPVTDVAKWRSISSDLAKLVRQSTGDQVDLEFTPRKTNERHPDYRATHFELEEPRATSVVLLSDGLDSLCGAFEHLQQRQHERVAFVSLVTNNRKGARIHTVREALRRLRPRDVAFTEASLHLCDPPRADEQERTQRSRTMLAIAAGLTVAAAYRASEVSVSENGMGILNLPVPGLQLAHHSSQVLHPTNLRLWKRVAVQILGPLAGRIDYPNRFRTKAQMCLELPQDAHPLIRSTSSCDRPDRYDKNDSCGRCGSCIVRKLALSGAGLSAHDIAYSGRPASMRRGDFDAVLVQRHHAAAIDKALTEFDPWAALLRSHPTLHHLFSEESSENVDHLRSSTLALLRRHVDEVFAYESQSRAG